MYFQFGSYRHPNNEVNLTSYEAIPRYSPRGQRTTYLLRLHASGLLLCDDQDGTAAERQSNLNSKINQLVDAYSLANMDQSCGLYHDDGTVTRHRLESSATNPANISGVRLAYRSWPKGDAAEYATGREFYIILEAEVTDNESEVIEYRETVSLVGTGGPRYRVVELEVAPPIVEIVNVFTKVDVVQEGTVIGFQTYLQPPGPLLPQYEYQDLRMVRRMTPDAFGRGFRNYRTDYRYVMVLPAYIPLAPHIL